MTVASRSLLPQDLRCSLVGSKPIRYSNGQIVLQETDLRWSGFGFSLHHRRSYANIIASGTGPGGHGHHWFGEDQPCLSFGTDPATRLPTIGAIFGTHSSKWFLSDGSGGWLPRFGGHFSLTHRSSAHEYVLTSPRGVQTIFHDDSSTVDPLLRGKLKAMRSPGGAAPRSPGRRAGFGNPSPTPVPPAWAAR